MQVISKKRNKKADGKIPGSDPQTKIKQKRKISVSVTPEIELNSINHRYRCLCCGHTYGTSTYRTAGNRASWKHICQDIEKELEQSYNSLDLHTEPSGNFFAPPHRDLMKLSYQRIFRCLCGERPKRFCRHNFCKVTKMHFPYCMHKGKQNILSNKVPSFILHNHIPGLIKLFKA